MWVSHAWIALSHRNAPRLPTPGCHLCRAILKPPELSTNMSNASSTDQQKLAVRSMLQSKDLTRRVKTVSDIVMPKVMRCCRDDRSTITSGKPPAPLSFSQQLEKDLLGNDLNLSQLRSRCNALEGATKDITSLMLAMQSKHWGGFLGHATALRIRERRFEYYLGCPPSSLCRCGHQAGHSPPSSCRAAGTERQPCQHGRQCTTRSKLAVIDDRQHQD